MRKKQVRSSLGSFLIKPKFVHNKAIKARRLNSHYMRAVNVLYPLINETNGKQGKPSLVNSTFIKFGILFAIEQLGISIEQLAELCSSRDIAGDYSLTLSSFSSWQEEAADISSNEVIKRNSKNL